MPSAALASLPHAKNVPAWTGPRQADDVRGCLFAKGGAGGSTVLTFDREGRDFALTVYGTVDVEVELYGRRWTVVRPLAEMLAASLAECGA